jgi:hypothetical protein
MAIKDDKIREDRIHNEIVVDAYDESERAMGWFYYLEDTMEFPFKANCIEKKATSPLKKGEEVEVLELASGDDCEHEIFVTVSWEKRKLAVPLAQLEPVKSDAKTREAVEDWHYWVQRGYEF